MTNRIHWTTHGLHKRWAHMTIINLLFLLISPYKDLHHPLSCTVREGHVNGKWRTGYVGKVRRRNCELYITVCQLLAYTSNYWILSSYHFTHTPGTERKQTRTATILHRLREQKESKQEQCWWRTAGRESITRFSSEWFLRTGALKILLISIRSSWRCSNRGVETRLLGMEKALTARVCCKQQQKRSY